MKIKVFTLAIDNYFPELTKLSIPTIRTFAQNMGAEFEVIRERKLTLEHPDLPVTYEKLQVYDLFDFDIVMLKFANRCWGKKADGAESSLESSDVVGKLLLAQWRFRFQLTTVSDDCRAGGILILAVRKNV